jgi:hypothetical protein
MIQEQSRPFPPNFKNRCLLAIKNLDDVVELIAVFNLFDWTEHLTNTRLEPEDYLGPNPRSKCAEDLGAHWRRISLLLLGTDPVLSEEIALGYAAKFYHKAVSINSQWLWGGRLIQVMTVEIVKKMLDSQYGIFLSLQPFSQGRAALRYGCFSTSLEHIHYFQTAPHIRNKPGIDGTCLFPLLRKFVERPDFELERDVWFVLYLCEMCTWYVRFAFFRPSATAFEMERYRFVVQLAWDSVVVIGNELRARVAARDQNKSHFEAWFGSNNTEEEMEMAYFQELERNVGQEVELVASSLADHGTGEENS